MISKRYEGLTHGGERPSSTVLCSTQPTPADFTLGSTREICPCPPYPVYQRGLHGSVHVPNSLNHRYVRQGLTSHLAAASTASRDSLVTSMNAAKSFFIATSSCLTAAAPSLPLAVRINPSNSSALPQGGKRTQYETMWEKTPFL